MGANSENFCLRWNDFESNVSGAFRDLRAESDFFDVTLGCTDAGGRSLQAHKVILSACSSFFKHMLRQQSNQHPNHPNPFIYLRGVSFSDLSSVLDFMYHGEVNVAQEDLNSFLAVAEELQIKGLTNKESQSGPSQQGGVGEPSKDRKMSSGGSGMGGQRSRSDGGPSLKKPRRSSPTDATAVSPIKAPPPSDNPDVKQVDIKSDPEAGPSGAQQAVSDYGDPDAEYADESYGEGYYDDNGESGAGDIMESDMATVGDGDGTDTGGKGLGVAPWNGGGAVCLVCGKQFGYMGNARVHYMEQHTRVRQGNYSCHVCGRSFKFARTRNNHLSSHHGITQKMMKNRISVAQF